MRKTSLSALLTYFFVQIFFCAIINGQETKTGYILEIRDDRVFLDLKSGEVTIGNRLQVSQEGGFFVHPVTGEKIKEEDEVIAILEVIDVRSNYSIATAYPPEAISKLQKGAEVTILLNTEGQQSIFKKSVAVQPLTVSNIQGYLGIYIGDVLTEQLLKNNMFRVLDRQTLGLQADQIVLSSGGVLTESELLKYSSGKGADYYITGSMYEPDVVELSSGIPIKNIVKLAGYAAEAATGKDLKVDRIAEFVPDKTEIKRLKAIVRISLRVVDVKTGEIKFMCTEMQQAEGESDINIEGGLLGGLKIRGGVTSFSNTITGKATQLALENLTDYIFDYFNGNIVEKTYTGNIIEIAELDKRIKSDEKRDTIGEILITEIIKQPAKESRLLDSNPFNDTTYLVTLNKGSDFEIKPKNILKVYTPSYESSELTGEKLVSKIPVIGYINITSSFKDQSEGKMIFKEGYNPVNFDHRISYAKVKHVWNGFFTISKLDISNKEDKQIHFPGIGYMIKWKIGAYGFIGTGNFQYLEIDGKWHTDRSHPYVGFGVLISLSPSTSLGLGISGAEAPTIDLTINSRIGKSIFLIYGLSVPDPFYWHTNTFCIPIGIGFLF